MSEAAQFGLEQFSQVGFVVGKKHAQASRCCRLHY
jgi:hypothetical protein